MARKAMTADDLAALLGCTTRTLRNMEAKGTGPKRIIENLEPKYPMEFLVPWLRKNRPDIDLGTAARESDEASRLRLLERWESVLRAKYGVDTTQMLYQTIQHAHFHEGCGALKVPDPPQFWTTACYAAFAGVVLGHHLGYGELRELINDFDERNHLGLATGDMTPAEFSEQISESLVEQAFAEIAKADELPMLRNERNHVADAFRYAVCVADDYIWPEPYLAGSLTRAQLAELNSYLEFVSCERLIPACKQVRQAAQRQLDDLQRSRAGEQMAG